MSQWRVSLGFTHAGQASAGEAADLALKPKTGLNLAPILQENYGPEDRVFTNLGMSRPMETSV